MRHIYKVSYEKSSTQARQVYDNRFEFETTIKLPFKIKPYKSRGEYQLYYLPTVEIEQKIAKIYEFDRKIERQVLQLPPIAHAHFILDIQIEELQNTNEIEGVRSTRKELNLVKRKMVENPKVKYRFQSLINSYNKLLSGELTAIKNAQDIRKIYDYLVLDEIEEDDLPDGKTFTKEVSQVTRQSGSGKVIHEGLTTEERKIEYMESMIRFMDAGDLPLLIKVSVFHFLFGYVHPFYDGNGRTSRFITSMYLNETLSEWTAISLSRGCNKFRKDYLNAFEYANLSTNFGEMNVFIEGFLTILEQAQQITLLDLVEKTRLLDLFVEFMDGEECLQNKKNSLAKDILFILAQDFYFSIEDVGITRSRFHEILENSPKSHIVPALKFLVEKGYVEESGKSPIYYKVNKEIVR